LDVHPPHEPIHTWRDFFLHLATITVGLLIALGLEGAVEYLHHRHIVAEARENIRHELELNEAAARDDQKNLETNKKNMQANLVVLRVIRSDPKAMKGKHMSYNFDWSSFNESAWISARDSGALTYMPTSEVQTYADIYNQQEVVTNQAVATFTRESEVFAPFLMEPDDSSISHDEAQGMLRETALTYARLDILRQLCEELSKAYADALKK
jgi:hypothetical protein